MATSTKFSRYVLAGIGMMLALSTTGRAASSVEILHGFSSDPSSLTYVYGGLVEATPGVYYGTASYGGPPPPPPTGAEFGLGGIYKIDVNGPAPVTTVFHQFSCDVDATGHPFGDLVKVPNGMLYGVAWGADFPGCDGIPHIFRVDPATDTISIVYDLDGLEGTASGFIDGGGGTLYCVGTNGFVLAFDTATNTLTTIFQLDYPTDGAYPDGLLLASDGWLYGATSLGPLGAGNGTLYRLHPSDPAGTFTTIHLFNDAVNKDGMEPHGNMVETSPGEIYGITSRGGATGNGVIFRVSASAAGASVTSVVSLGPAEDNPFGRLLHASDGLLYGTGFNYFGGAFGVDISGADPVVVPLGLDFQSGYFANGGVIEGSDGLLYGTTVLGGTGGFGTAFRFSKASVSNSGPSADAGGDQTPECTGPGGCSVTLDGSGSSDADDDTLTFTWTEGATTLATTTSPTAAIALSLGAHTIALSVNDGNGGTDTDTVLVTVRDTTAPAIATASASPNILNPASNKMVPVLVTVDASDLCSSFSCEIVSVSSNQPVGGRGGGKRSPDWEVTGPLTVDLRAERTGKGKSDRVYSILIRCQDASGNAANRTVTVTVPH